MSTVASVTPAPRQALVKISGPVDHQAGASGSAAMTPGMASITRRMTG